MIGLSTGLASILFIYLWVNDELKTDKFHEHDSRLYQVIEHIENNNTITTHEATSGPMAEALINEMPEVEYAAAVVPPSWFGRNSLSVGETNIKALGQMVGKDYFNIFSYKLVQGDKDQILEDKNSIVISEKLALNLFQTTENIVGKTVEFEHERQFQVTGVFEEVPANSTVQFDFAISFEALKEISPWNSTHVWSSSGPQVYVLLKEGTNIEQLNAKVGMIIKNRYEESSRTPALVSYSENYLYGVYENGVQVGGRVEYVKLFTIIALIILIIACINFMNLSTARASLRLKEIGIKKVVGAKRSVFIFQFLVESIVMAFMALTIALVLVAFFLPQFNEIIGKHLVLNFDLNFILTISSIALFAGLIAGSYPALYLSGFNAIIVLKGKLDRSFGELWTRKGLVVVQFSLSIILIVSVLVVYKQIEFVQNRNLGYKQDNIVHFKVEGKIKERLATFISEVKQISGVKNASSTTHDMMGHNWTVGIDWEGRDEDNFIPFQVVGVDYDLIETLGMKMASGHSFSREYGADSLGIIFNETAIKEMNLKDPIGKNIRFMGEKIVIGTIKDFHFKSLHEKVEPLLLVMMPNSVKKVMIRIEAGKEQETLDNLQAFHQSFNPGFPFEYEFLDENYQALYASEQRVASLSKYFAGLAILISCLGLFGLAIFTAERRRKEISIRKVLGQSATQITVMLSSEFSILVLVSILFALPIAYLLANNWLSNFAYRIPLHIWYFIGAGSTALLVAMMTVGSQAIRAANKNPIDGLREE